MANVAHPKTADSHVSADHPDLLGEHVENANELGTVQIHNSVIATIARVAALKIDGVVDLSGGLVDGLAGMIGKKSADRGVRVEFEDSSVVIDVHVILAFGVRIPHVAWQLQNEIRKAVEQMTGKPVRAVNIIVQGIRVPPPAQTREEESQA
ncbi:MAG: Asp23/Gls24 family envelope stress response protein [Kiritimatiellae bacterium]|nr:Asp23/Gls24 family envelope stress response protein [Kiritimatiellia bacterium]MDW8458099.1 Asp23/Gls24 family envelope stress response protein [Verrucomicrobiota bacterium]